MATTVRALQACSFYHGDVCISLEEGEEITGEAALAALLSGTLPVAPVES